jgi:hypothetical protein
MFLCRTPHGRHWYGTDTSLIRNWHGTDTVLTRNWHGTDTVLTRHWQVWTDLNDALTIRSVLRFPLTSWSRRLQNPLVTLLLQKFTAFKTTLLFITVFTTAHHLHLSWTISTYYYSTRAQTARFAYVTSLGVEEKQSDILCKPKTLSTGTKTASWKLLQLGTNVCSMDSMLEVWKGPDLGQTQPQEKVWVW